MNKCCGSCEFWAKQTDLISPFNDGICSKIDEKVTAELQTGWDGGYVKSFSTDEDFCCSLWEEKKQ